MGEKKGGTVKKKYDFNTAAVLEVQIKGNWYRTTCNEFRSFDGARRITEIVRQPSPREELVNPEFNTFTYTGPVYLQNTNEQVVPTGIENIIRTIIKK
jgi:hypothetical protein